MPGYPGVDLSSYPGTPKMDWLKKNTNLVWCGFYLGKAPSHPGTDWMQTRDTLVKQGWGVAPLYVGQQVTGPGSHKSSASQGVADAKDAVALMKAAGFKQGSCVYLDLENGAPFTNLQRDYVGSWVDGVVSSNYTAGIYCSHTFAVDVHALRSSARIWVFKVGTTAPHQVPGTNFPDNHPAGSGYSGAFIWQLGQHCLISVPGAPNGLLEVDLDSAVTSDPGAP